MNDIFHENMAQITDVIGKAKSKGIELSPGDFMFHQFAWGLEGPFIDGMDPLEWLDAMTMD